MDLDAKYSERVDFGELVGRTFTQILKKAEDYDETLHFEDTEGRVFEMYHSQDCCESVSIEDINGDLEDLIGEPITVAEERTSSENPPDVKPETLGYQDSFTWTFYTIGTRKGTVTIRWYGSSNGYYSESVNLYLLPKGNK